MDAFHQDPVRYCEAGENSISQLSKLRARMRACPDQYASAVPRKGQLARFLLEFQTMRRTMRMRCEEIGGFVLPKGDLQITVSLLSGVSWDVKLPACTWLPLRLCDLKERLARSFQVPAACQVWLLGDLILHDSMLVGDVFWDCNGSKVEVTMLKLQALTWDDWHHLGVRVRKRKTQGFWFDEVQFAALDQITLKRLALGIVKEDGTMVHSFEFNGLAQEDLAGFAVVQAQRLVASGADQAPVLDYHPDLEVVEN